MWTENKLLRVKGKLNTNEIKINSWKYLSCIQHVSLSWAYCSYLPCFVHMMFLQEQDVRSRCISLFHNVNLCRRRLELVGRNVCFHCHTLAYLKCKTECISMLGKIVIVAKELNTGLTNISWIFQKVLNSYIAGWHRSAPQAKHLQHCGPVVQQNCRGLEGIGIVVSWKHTADGS